MKRLREVGEERTGARASCPWDTLLEELIGVVASFMSQPKTLLSLRCVNKHWRNAFDSSDFFPHWERTVKLWRQMPGHWGYSEYAPDASAPTWKDLAQTLPSRPCWPILHVEMPLYPCGEDECLGKGRWEEHRQECAECRSHLDKGTRTRERRIDLGAVTLVPPMVRAEFADVHRPVAILQPRYRVHTFGVESRGYFHGTPKRRFWARCLAFYEQTDDYMIYEVGGEQLIPCVLPRGVPSDIPCARFIAIV